MTKVLVERELLQSLAYMELDTTANSIQVQDKARAILARPAHDVEASVPTFPCEFCGAFHSYSEVAEAGGYCPQCDADYDERKMFADLVTRYTALAAAPQPQSDAVIVPRAIAERMAIDAAQYEHEHAVVNDNVQLWQQPNARLTLTVGDLRTVRALLGGDHE